MEAVKHTLVEWSVNLAKAVFTVKQECNPGRSLFADNSFAIVLNASIQ